VDEVLFKWYSCGRKKNYATKNDARSMCGIRKKTHGIKGLNAYKCPHCGAWHIGHKKEEVVK